MVVVNNSGMPLRIEETHQIIPSDGRPYVLPYSVAIKYKGILTPIQMSDDPPPPQQVQPAQMSPEQTVAPVNVGEEIDLNGSADESEETSDEEAETTEDLEPMAEDEIDSTDNKVKDEAPVRPNSRKSKPLTGVRISRAKRTNVGTKKSNK